MMTWALLSAIAAAAAFLASGYILGVKKGQSARESLRKELAGKLAPSPNPEFDWSTFRRELDLLREPVEKTQSMVSTIRTKLSSQQASVPQDETKLEEVKQALAALPEATAQKLNAQLATKVGSPNEEFAKLLTASEFRAAVKALIVDVPSQTASKVATLKAQPSQAPSIEVDLDALAEKVGKALKPHIEEAVANPKAALLKPKASRLPPPNTQNSRVTSNLSSKNADLVKQFSGLAAEGGVGHGLEKLLEAMILRSKGLIRCAVISDETGLPLAGTKGCENIEALAGISSLLLFVTKRIPRHGGIAPESVLMLAAQKETVLYRVFKTGDQTYILSVVSDEPRLAPEIFEPIVTKLTRLLPGKVADPNRQPSEEPSPKASSLAPT